MKQDVTKAKELVKSSKIYRLASDTQNLSKQFIVKGNKADYLVSLPDFCTCTHFNMICTKEKYKICKHILACKILNQNAPNLTINDWQSYIFESK